MGEDLEEAVDPGTLVLAEEGTAAAAAAGEPTLPLS